MTVLWLNYSTHSSITWWYIKQPSCVHLNFSFQSVPRFFHLCLLMIIINCGGQKLFHLFWRWFFLSFSKALKNSIILLNYVTLMVRHCCFKCLPTFPDGDLWAMLMNLEAFGLINLMNDFLLKASERRMLCVMAEIVLHGLEAYRSAVDGSSSSDTATNHGNMKHRSIKIGPKNDLPYFLCFRRHSLTPHQICPWQRSLDCLFLAQRKW